MSYKHCGGCGYTKRRIERNFKKRTNGRGWHSRCNACRESRPQAVAYRLEQHLRERGKIK